jgi:hypothetical protein
MKIDKAVKVLRLLERGPKALSRLNAETGVNTKYHMENAKNSA